MFILILFCCVISIVNCKYSNSSINNEARAKRNADFECGIPWEYSSYITGGQQIKRGDYPWLVAIWRREENRQPEYICGGNLISAQAVITAAHCLQDKDQASATKPKDLLIMFGAHNLTNNFEPDRIQVVPSEVKIHRGWNPYLKRYNDDIAILILEDEIRFTKHIRPICLLNPSVNYDFSEGIVAGWGASEDTTKVHENIPRLLEIPIAESNEQCYRENYLLAKIGSQNSFCAGKPDVGVCLGDSGSGFMTKFENRFHLKEIVSSSLKDPSGCYTKNYAVYTDVPKYADWIEKETPQPTSTVSTTLSVSHVPTIKPSQAIFEADCGKISLAVGLVIGGSATIRGQWPFLVSLYDVDKDIHFCGGSLITNQHVLTAAHCLKYKGKTEKLSNRKILVLLGRHNLALKSEPYSKSRNVQESYIHPDWNVNDYKWDADLAILLMDEPVKFSKVIQPVCLPQNWEIFKSIDEGTLVGWGTSESTPKNKLSEDIPRHATLKVVNNSYCYSTDHNIAKMSSVRTFCAVGNGTGPCRGDSGGGLYTKVDDSWNLRGIVSASLFHLDGSCNTDKFSIYTKISDFFDWIYETVVETSQTP